MIDTTHITLHPDGASAKDANQAMGRTKGKAPSGRGYAHGMPLRAIITQDTVADCQKAATLMAGFTAAQLLADRGYDTNSVIAQSKDTKDEGGDSTEEGAQSGAFL